MMRTIVVLCMVLVIALSFGCSKKKEEPPKPEGAALQQPKEISIFDPVSKEEVALRETAYSYEYNGIVYPFSSAQNMEAFKADPEKYLQELNKPEAPKPEGQ